MNEFTADCRIKHISKCCANIGEGGKEEEHIIKLNVPVHILSLSLSLSTTLLQIRLGKISLGHVQRRHVCVCCL